jgi:uncharacterized protein (DUF4213/DUF364 family)
MQTDKTVSKKRVTERIAEILAGKAREKNVADVRIGLGYTAVLLDDGCAGVAYTFRGEAGGGCSVFHALRPISGRPAFDLLSLVESADPIEAAVGLACANAITNRQDRKFDVGDILDHLDVGPDDSVGMVGHFQPLVGRLKERCGSLTIFERIEEPEDNIRPVKEVGDLLPKCQVSLITGTSIINQTIDGLLDAAKSCRQVAVLGASTPMLPEVFSGSNVTLLSGVIVEDPKEILRVVSEGGGMRLFKPYIRKVNLSVGKGV